MRRYIMPSLKVAVICGCGVATSTVVKLKLEKLFEENGIDAKIATGSAPEADTLTIGADLIIATTKMPKDYGIPVVNGVSLISGVGEEETKKEIVETLNQM
jgi:PTS system galactitol-specific IIB component